MGIKIPEGMTPEMMANMASQMGGMGKSPNTNNEEDDEGNVEAPPDDELNNEGPKIEEVD